MATARNVIFLGDKGSGKTNLLHAIHGSAYNPNHSSSETFNWYYKMDSNCNACDTVSGEDGERQSATQLPIAHNFCFVIDGTKDIAEQIAKIKQYHHNYILPTSFKDGNPAYNFVVTKIDSPSYSDGLLTPYKNELSDTFGSDITYHAVSAKSNIGLESLKEVLCTLFVKKFTHADFVRLKQQVVNDFNNYIKGEGYYIPIPAMVLRFFQHHHDERAISIRNCIINNTTTLDDIYIILMNQKNLLEHALNVIQVPTTLVPETKYTTSLKNQPDSPVQSGYYSEITRSIARIKDANPNIEIPLQEGITRINSNMLA